MNKRERIGRAIAGEPVDRVPYSVWLHNFLEENSAAALADETLRLLDRFDFDLLKPQSRPYCFGQMWGLEFEPSKHADVFPRVTRPLLRDAADLASIGRVSGRSGALEEQVRAFALIRERVGPDTPIIATVFAPLMVLTLGHAGGARAVFELQRSHPDALEQALANMADTLADFAALCIEAGVDGIFYATTTANAGQVTRAEWERFQRPFDERILRAAAGGAMNVLHVCGNAIQAEWFHDYPAAIVSWATTQGNPSLAAMHALTGKCVMGGVPGKPQFGPMRTEALARHVNESLDAMRGRFHILGPDCSVNPGSAPAQIETVMDAVRRYRPPA
jgi:uroporphyrinogen decarboxylase